MLRQSPPIGYACQLYTQTVLKKYALLERFELIIHWPVAQCHALPDAFEAVLVAQREIPWHDSASPFPAAAKRTTLDRILLSNVWLTCACAAWLLDRTVVHRWNVGSWATSHKGTRH